MSYKFEILSKIGGGQFGAVYLGKKRQNGELVALKFETIDNPYLMLKHEAKILHYLYEHGCRQIPSVFWFGIYDTHRCIAMSYYECSLEEFIQKDNISVNSKIHEHHFSKMMEIVEHVHDKFVIHCDIKPQNFMIKQDELFLIDFGLSKIYVDEENAHISDTKHDHTILGTPKYISVNIHQGHGPSRRDDVISCVYIYMFSKMKTLPWENIPQREENGDNYSVNHLLYYKNQERMTLKQDTNLALSNHNLGKLLNTFYQLRFEERPDYRKGSELITS